jgi:hypothetical protein
MPQRRKQEDYLCEHCGYFQVRSVCLGRILTPGANTFNQEDEEDRRARHTVSFMHGFRVHELTRCRFLFAELGM